MATYTVSQGSINNGSRDVVINSGELPQNINVGDFLCIGQFAPMEINRVYFNEYNSHLLALWKKKKKMRIRLSVENVDSLWTFIQE